MIDNSTAPARLVFKKYLDRYTLAIRYHAPTRLWQDIKEQIMSFSTSERTWEPNYHCGNGVYGAWIIDEKVWEWIEHYFKKDVQTSEEPYEF
jgi:hypothetical protein